MLFAIIIAFFIGGFLGFLMACLLCSIRTTESKVYFLERFSRDPLHPTSGKFLAN